jgi:hypothetical protein
VTKQINSADSYPFSIPVPHLSSIFEFLLLVVSMGRNQPNAKNKSKIKGATHVPSSTLRQASGTMQSVAHRVKVKKLKVVDSGFRVTDSSFCSDVNGAIKAFTWKETNLSDSEMDVVWNRVHQSAGWDQGYVDSFLSQDKLPPANDPELPKPKGVSR